MGGRYRFLKTLLPAVALTLAGATLHSPAATAADVIVIKADQSANAKGPWQTAMEKFRDIVAEKTAGHLKIEIFPDGVLTQGNLRTTIQMMQSGALKMGIFLPAFYEQFDPRWLVFSLPYLFKDQKAAYATCDGDVGKYMLETLRDKGIQGLVLWEHGFRHFTTAKKPIRLPTDMSGMKMRVMGSPTYISMVKGLNANPTATSMGELFAALQQGVVDGQENPINTMYLRRFYEVQKYLVMTYHVWYPAILGVNAKFFDSLSKEEQKILLDAAEEVKPLERALVREEEERMMADLKGKIEIVTLTEAELKAWKEATKPVHEEAADKIGRDLLARFYKAAGY